MKYTITQISKINTQGAQKFINIRKEFHDDLKVKGLFGKDLKITVTFDTDVESN